MLASRLKVLAVAALILPHAAHAQQTAPASAAVATPTAPAKVAAPVKQSMTMGGIPWERLPLNVKNTYPKEKWAALSSAQRSAIVKENLQKPRPAAASATNVARDPKRDAIRAKWDKMTPAERLKFKKAHPSFVPPPPIKKQANTTNKPNWDTLTTEERMELNEKIKAKQDAGKLTAPIPDTASPEKPAETTPTPEAAQ